MRDPLLLYEEEFERTKKSPFRCLQHGDVWHNNCIFKKLPNNETKLALVDWQVLLVLVMDHQICSFKVNYPLPINIRINLKFLYRFVIMEMLQMIYVT